MAASAPVSRDAVRIVFLRPKDPDDGANGGAASIEVNAKRIGALHYGGFLYVDVPWGPADLTAFGRYRALGACEVDVITTPGATVFVDVGPRLSYMVAGAVGGVAGGVAGAAAVPDVYGSVGGAVTTGAAGVAAGDAAGTVTATSMEGRGKTCRGPYQLELIPEQAALPHLADLAWSRD